MDKYDNTCSALEILTEASVRFELLSNNYDDKVDFFFKIMLENIQQFIHVSALFLYLFSE